MSYQRSLYIRGVQILLAAVPLVLLLNLSAQAGEGNIKAFVNVNVIPMDTERVLKDFTVVVNGDRISAIGPSSSQKVPTGAEIINGNGAFLMPGLADMHMHLTFDPSPDIIRTFLAEGVTTIRNLAGFQETLKLRDEVISGLRIGPTIYTSGPAIIGPLDQITVWIFRALIIGVLLAIGIILFIILWLSRRLRSGSVTARPLRRSIIPGIVILIIVGVLLILAKVVPINIFASMQFPFAYFPDTVDRARAEVRRQQQAGYDFIKVYDYLTEDQYLAVIDEAQRVGIYTVGHLDYDTEAALAAGLNEAAHVDEFLDTHLMGEISPIDFKPVAINYSLIPDTVASVVKHDANVVSNMTTDVVTYEFLEAGPDYFKRPEYDVIRPETTERWLSERMVKWQGQQEWRRNTVQPFLKKMIQKLHEADVVLLTGTDFGVEGCLPSHIHRELLLLVDAGLTNYEALVAGTKNAGLSVKRMGVSDSFGEVVVGQRADLVLLESNPLENVQATRQRLGVMSRGRWYTKAELDNLVAELVSTY
jgi:imidazolonepropionase-like amidohydrolase